MIGTRGGLIIALFALLSMGLEGNAQTGNWKAAAALPSSKKKGRSILANVQQRAGKSLTIRYRVPEVEIDEIQQGNNGEIRTRVNLGNAPLTAKAGEPVLPVIPVQFIIPPGSEITDIAVTPQLVTKRSLSHAVEYGATAVPLMRNAKVKKIPPKREIYDSDAPFPRKKSELVTVQRKRGVAIGIINLHPVTYYPQNNSIEYCRECEITVTFTPTRSFQKEARRMRSSRLDVRKLGVENPEAIKQYQEKENSDAGMNVPMDQQMQLDPGESFQYVVITNEVMRDAETDLTVNDLVANRQKSGLTATIVTIESIRDDYQGVDDQQKVRNFIIDAYTNWETEYVVLGGDVKIVPIRMLYDDGDVIASDLYYQCLDGPFNGDGDNYWGEPNDGIDGGDVDLLAEVMIGRLSAETPEEMANAIFKIFSYEQDSDAEPYLQKSCILGEELGSQFGPGMFSFAFPYMCEIKNGSSAAGYTTVGFSANPAFSLDSLYDYIETWTAGDLIERINSDQYSLVNHLGHADTDNVMKMSLSDADKLENSKFLFTFSQGCFPGDMTVDCIAEHLTTSTRNGLFAGVFNSHYGYGAYNESIETLDGPSQRIHRQFWDAYFGEYIYNLGGLLADAHEDNLWDINGDLIRWCIYETNLFGDPFTVIRGQTQGPRVVYRSVNVDDESGNADGLVNPGETIDLLLSLRNIGNSVATGVTAQLSINDPYITIHNGNVSFSDIQCCGVNATAENSAVIAISPDCPTPYTFPVTLDITDSDGNSWEGLFSLTVYTSYTVSGSVLTKTGNTPVPGATVSYEGPLSGTAISNADGAYVFSVIDGKYTLTAGADGYLNTAPVGISLPPEVKDVNLFLGRPEITVIPMSIEQTLDVDDSVTIQMEVANNGDMNLMVTPSVRQKSVVLSKGTPELIRGVQTKRAGKSYADLSKTTQRLSSSSRYAFSNESLRFGPSQRVLYLNTIIWDDVPDEFASGMMGLPDIEVFDLLNGEVQTPDINYLNQYDVVIVSSNSSWADPELLGNTLADYIDGGGKLIMLVASFAEGGGYAIGGRIVTSEYLPLQSGGPGDFSESATFESHPINENVSYLATSIPVATSALQGEGVSLGTYSTGYHIGAFNPMKPVVAINVFPEDGTWEGDLVQMTGNTIKWFAQVSWLSIENGGELVTIAPGGTARIPVKLRSLNQIGGSYSGEILLSHNDPQLGSPLAVPVELTIKGYKKLAAAPLTIDYGKLWLGLSDTVEVMLTNNGTQRTTISAVSSDHGSFTVAGSVPLNVYAGKSVPLPVVFTPRELGTASGSVTITSDAEDNPEIVVSVIGHGTPGPQAELTPDEMFFKLAHDDEPADRTATLANIGGDVLSYRSYIKPVQKPSIAVAAAVKRAKRRSMERLIYSQYNYKNEFARDRVIVALTKGSSTLAQPSLLDRLGNGTVREIGIARVPGRGVKVFNERTLLVVPLADQSRDGVIEAIKALRDDINVAYAEPDYLLKAVAVPNDPMFNEQYALNNTGQTGGTDDADIDAVEAWDVFTGEQSRVILGIIDTGIDYLHPDLAANIWTNEGEIPDNGIDDDNNGYVDDIHGYDFAYDDNDPMDVYGHGTHCSGSAAAAGNDGQGVSGVSWGARLMALKFLDDGGSGATSDAIDAVTYATAMGATITSNSWGGGGYSEALYEVIAASGLFVAAAGNSSMDADMYPEYPAAYDLDNIISVAATDYNDELADFSNYGATSVDMAAPGVDILSSVPGNDYRLASGTSMATPHVAGCAVLLKGYNEGVSSDEIKAAILDGTDRLTSLDGRCLTGGRLNVQKSLESISPPWITLAPNTPGSIEPNNANDFTVRVDPQSMVAGVWVAEVTYHTDDPHNPEQVLAVQADIAPCREIAADKKTYSFGTVWVSRDSVLTVEARNTCNAPVTISTLTFSQSQFTPDRKTPITVPPFGSTHIPIRFTPDAAGSFTAELTINSDADNNQSLTVELTASAVMPPEIAIAPSVIDRTLAYEVTEDIPVTLTNTGGADFHFKIKKVRPPEKNGYGLDNAKLFISQNFGNIRRINPVTGEIIADIIQVDGSDFDGLAYDGEYLYYSNMTNEIQVIDVEAGIVVKTITCRTPSGIDGIGVTGEYLLLGNYFENLMHICSKETGELIGEWAAEGLVGGVTCSESRNSVFYYNYLSEVIEERTIIDGSLLHQIKLSGRYVMGLGYSEEASALIAASPSDGIYIINPDDGSIIATLPVYNVFALAGDEISNSLQWMTSEIMEGIVPAGGTMTVNEQFNSAEMLPGTYTGILRCIHKEPFPPGPFDVDCHMTVLPENRCGTSVEQLQFTDTWLGRTDTMVFSIRNTGNAPTVVSSISTNRKVFTVLSETGFTIPPFDSVEVAIGFTPKKKKSVEGKCSIISDALRDPKVKVALLGSAVKPPKINYTPDQLRRVMLPGTERSSTITMKNRGGTDYRFNVEVRPADGTNPGAGQLYGSGYEVLYRLDPMTGQVVDQIPTTIAQRSIAFDGSKLYAVNDDYTSIVIINPETGERIDTLDIQISDYADILDIGVDKQYLFMTVYVDTGLSVMVLDKKDGALLRSWSTDWKYESISGGRDPNTFYLMNTKDRILELRSAESGEVLSELGLSVYGYQVTYSRSLDMVFVSDGYEHFVINPQSGQGVASFRTDDYLRISADEGAGVTWLSTAVTEGVVGKKGTFSLDCIFDSERMLPGVYQAEVVVTHEFGWEPGPFVFPCELKVLPLKKLSAMPSTMDFGSVWTGSDSVQQLTLTNGGNSATTVYSILSLNKKFSMEQSTPFTVKPFSSTTVNTHFAPDRTGTYKGYNLIISNAIDLPLVMVTTTGSGVSAPDISINPEQFTFQLPEGGSASEELTLQNSGQAEYSFTIRARDTSPKTAAGASKLYIGTSDLIYELDPETFKQIGEPISMMNEWIEGLAFDGEYIYGTSPDKSPVTINKFDANDPTSVQVLETGIKGIVLGLGVTDENIVALELFDELIYFLDKNDGSIIRTLKCPMTFGALTVAQERNSFFVFSFENFTMQEWDIEEGTLKNEFPVPGELYEPSGAGYSTASHTLFISSEDGIIVEVNPEDGTVINSAQTAFKSIYALASDEAGAFVRWLNLSAMEGVVNGNSSLELKVTADAAELVPGDYSGEITITPVVEAAPGPFVIPCNLSVATQETAAAE